MTIHKTSERPPQKSDNALVFTYDGGKTSIVIAWHVIDMAWIEQTGDHVAKHPNLYTHWFDPKQTPADCKTVLDEVANERARQDAKWGQQNHAPMHWIPILVEEVGEASKAALEHHFKYPGADLAKYREELVQVAAVAVAMVECLDRNREAKP